MTLFKSLLLKVPLNALQNSKCQYSNKAIRNIGILAHIDAGKTTTTERMLFYAGKTRSLGEVHHGNTVTDYLSQERERGITICSSAVTFSWNGTRINLLDTPGHIDFTMEVEQSLHAVDGVIVVLDGTAGVEAQTMTVWEQAHKHQLPKMVFVNKMDRPDADFCKAMEDVSEKLEACALCLQQPHKDAKGTLAIYDLITLERLTWDPKNLGRTFVAEQLNEADAAFKEIQEKRYELIDKLSGIDDALAETVINNNGFETLTNDMIISAIRRATCQHKIVPVLLGSAYKNVGVQKLIDAVVHYLPAPNERNQFYDCFENDFAGKVFKIVHDKQRGALTLVRVFRGELKRGMRLSALNGAAEVVSKIYEPLADEYREVDAVQAGDVAICAGLKSTVTGDLLTSGSSSLKQAQKRLRKMQKKVVNDNDEYNNELMDEIFATKPRIPDAVFFCSIEPPSLSAQNTMELALKQLQREDPSLRVSYNEVTGQTVLGGMGELHMEVIKSRILTEYKIDVDLGPLQIAYKETVDKPILNSFHIEKEIAGSKQSVQMTMQLVKDKEELFSLDKSPENIGALNTLRPRILQIIKKGALAALDRGPRVGGQVVDTQVCLHAVTVGRGTADSFLMAATAQCVQKLLNLAGTRLLEPIMNIQIVATTEYVSSILADLSRRRAEINDVQPKSDKNKLILVNAPLAELSGYSTFIRTISSGTASMTMQPCGFAPMHSNDEEVAVRRIQGLE